MPAKTRLSVKKKHLIKPDKSIKTSNKSNLATAMSSTSINMSMSQTSSANVPLHTIPEHEFLRQQLLASVDDLLPDLIAIVVDYAFEYQSSSSYAMQMNYRPLSMQTPHGDEVYSAVMKQCSGIVHHDTVDHDMIDDELRRKLLQGWTVHGIVTWGQDFANGVSLQYRSPKADPNGDPIADHLYQVGAEPHGDHHNPSRQFHRLNQGEYITSFIGSRGVWMNYMSLTLNTGRLIEIGSPNGERLVKINFCQEPNARIVALRIGIGGHVHYAGCYYERMYPRTESEISAESNQSIKPVEIGLFDGSSSGKSSTARGRGGRRGLFMGRFE